VAAAASSGPSPRPASQYNGGTSGSTTTYKAIQTDASLNPANSAEACST